MIRTLVAWTLGTLVTCVASTLVLVPRLLYRSPRYIALVSYWWSRILLSLAGIRLTLDNAEITRDGETRFFVGNHQSALDIVILYAASGGNVRFLAKKSLFRIPFLGWVLSVHGHVPIDRGSMRATYQSLERMLASLKKARTNLVVFAEGTRSRDGRLLPFRKGGMKICQRAGLGVVPFSIDGSRAVLPPDRYRVRPGPVRLRFADPIPASEVAAMSSDQLHDRVRAAVEKGLPAISHRRGAEIAET